MAVALEPAWRGAGEIQSGRWVSWSEIPHESEHREGRESWGERVQSPPGLGGAEEAVGAGGSGRGLCCLCWGCAEG